ncbi:hypothetical protein BgiBS90_005483, partial [Biomphalaria glabrata]
QKQLNQGWKVGPSLLYRTTNIVICLTGCANSISPPPVMSHLLPSPLHDALPISPTSHDVLTLDSASHSPAITHDVSLLLPFPMIFYIFLQPPMQNPPLPSGTCSSTLPATLPD